MIDSNQNPYSFIVDAHEDIAYNWLALDRNPTEDALVGRKAEAGSSIAQAAGTRTLGLPQWLEGRIGLIFGTLFVMPRRHARHPLTQQVYTTPQEAFSLAQRQLEKYWELADRESQITLITNSDELEQVISTWTTMRNPGNVGLVILMEGADPIEEPAQVAQWYDRGVRIIGPAWSATRYAGGTGEPGPLTSLGHRLLGEMALLHMILDLSHMAEQAYLEAIDSFPGPTIASHSNPRKFIPSDRGLSDEMIHLLAQRDGVIGIVPFNRFLKPEWNTGDPRHLVSTQFVVDAIDYVAQLTGSSSCVGLGTDFDGGFGAESIPCEMDTIADLHLISDLLSSRGYSDTDIEQIMCTNWLRVLRSSLP